MVGVLIVGAVAGGLAGAVSYLFSRRFTRAQVSGTRSRASQRIATFAVIASVSATQCRPLVDWTNETLGLEPRLDIVSRSEGRRLLESASFRKLVQGKTPAEAQVIAAELGARGIQYLDDSEIDEWGRIKLALANLSPDVCAGMWRGPANPAAFAEATSKLSDVDLRTMARLTTTGSLRALDAGASSGFDKEGFDAGLEQIGERCSATEQASLSGGIAGTEPDDASACAFMKLILSKSQELPGSDRARFLRALSQLGVPPG